MNEKKHKNFTASIAECGAVVLMCIPTYFSFHVVDVEIKRTHVWWHRKSQNSYLVKALMVLKVFYTLTYANIR